MWSFALAEDLNATGEPHSITVEIPSPIRLGVRLAKLAGGVAVIRVGGSTEVEVKEKKDRVDDALHATRAAVEEGIVPGGGVVLLRAEQAVAKLKDENPEIQAGINIVLKALEAQS